MGPFVMYLANLSKRSPRMPGIPPNLDVTVGVFVNPLTSLLAVRSFGLYSTSDIITFDQNWHYLYSTSTGGKDLSNDA